MAALDTSPGERVPEKPCFPFYEPGTLSPSNNCRLQAGSPDLFKDKGGNSLPMAADMTGQNLACQWRARLCHVPLFLSASRALGQTLLADCYRSMDTPAAGGGRGGGGVLSLPPMHIPSAVGWGRPDWHVTNRHLAPAGNAGGTGFYLATGSLIPWVNTRFITRFFYKAL